jgi:predicted PurR-regulated permease PerM
MEFFIPGLLLFLLAVVVSFILAPRFTPLVVAVLSIVLLSYGVYDHYKMFAAEYRLSTWQQSLKIYAPAIMIGAIILFIIYAILAFFTKGSVPVPPIPNITAPNENSAMDNVVQSLNKVANGLTNNKNDIVSSVNNTINKANNNRGNILNALTGNNNGNGGNKNKRNNNLSRSFLETI